MADLTQDARSPRFSRRRFLAAAGLGAAGAAGLGACGEQTAPSAPTSYPRRPLARLADLRVGRPVNGSYPDDQSPVVLLKLGRRVPGGVGPDGDVVAFSRLCAHMGCTVEVRAGGGLLACPCHFSSFDVARGGMQVIGQATTNLAQVVLSVEGEEVVGVGMRGLIWGRQSNLQPVSGQAVP